MKIKDQVYKSYHDHISSHVEENRRGAMLMKDDAEHSALNCNGILEKTAHIPKVFDEEDVSLFKKISALSSSIFSKVIREAGGADPAAPPIRGRCADLPD